MVNQQWKTFKDEFVDAYKLAENQENSRLQICYNSLSSFKNQIDATAQKCSESMTLRIDPFGVIPFMKLGLGYMPLDFLKADIKEPEGFHVALKLEKTFTKSFNNQ